MRGCDDLRSWLTSAGFKVFRDSDPSRECDWYACRKTSLVARECETNEGKGVQIVVKPFSYTHSGTTHESGTVELVGKASGLWFTQQAYSLSTSEIKTNLDAIERMLVAAWNALNSDQR